MLDLSGNQRMCGEGPTIGSPSSTVHTASTGLGQDCSELTRGAQQLSGIMGIVLGECGER